MHPPSERVLLDVVAPSSPAGRQAVRSYMFDVASKYYARLATDSEVDAVIHEDPSEDLALPRGLLLIAHQGGAVLGCAGLRFLPGGIGEVKRVFVVPAARGRGLGTQLMEELEHLAREHNVSTLRLDTRRDLVEARRLYARLGYKEVPAFNDGPYADHWFAKLLA